MRIAGLTAIQANPVSKFSDFWPSSTNRETILGELISDRLVRRHSRGINSVVLGAMVSRLEKKDSD